ncbi:MAG: pyridoxamine 5'-phosphate oxidase family protein [Defluviitaleaceae bacterium]|nr:pyridoxamine 5'-phosphate oxidase family protein [Defluviitaleaceae bacterium]
MRRKDREITDFNEIIDILQRADTIRLGIHDDPFPYVVPLSFGFETNDGKVELYIHGAKEGLKHTLLDRNSNVCVEASIFHRYVDLGTDLTTEYESVIGFGAAQIIQGDEAKKGLDLICTHCGFDGYSYDIRALNVMRIYKITLSSITGKRRSV